MVIGFKQETVDKMNEDVSREMSNYLESLKRLCDSEENKYAFLQWLKGYGFAIARHSNTGYSEEQTLIYVARFYRDWLPADLNPFVSFLSLKGDQEE